MNGNFRKPEFVKRYEYTYYDLETPLNAVVANDARQSKDNYRFSVDNSSEANPIDWYNAYLEVDFNLIKKVDNSNVGAGTGNVNLFTTTTNGQSFIKKIEVECNGISVYNNTRANETSNVMSLLNYSKSYADTIGQDQFFFLDSKTGTAEPRPGEALYNEGFAKRKILTDAGNVNKISIPLNLYSYFAAFKNNLHPNIKTTIMLEIESDKNIVFRGVGTGDVTHDYKVIISKLRLWCPRIIFNGAGMKQYLFKMLSVFPPEFEGQDMCLFGLSQQQVIIVKSIIYSILKHSILVQITDISAEHKSKLTTVFITPNWR